MTNLTSFQQGLVNELIQEFSRINPKPTVKESTRFTLKTINSCQQKEEAFKTTITKHNLTMIKLFTNQIHEDMKAFKKEFGKVLDLQDGHFGYGREHGTLDILVKSTKEKPLLNQGYYEMNLFIVSKTQRYRGDNNYCGGMNYLTIYVDFKREVVSQIFESGKEVILNKIVGLRYSIYNCYKRDNRLIFGSLDELIQNDKGVQKKLVELAG